MYDAIDDPYTYKDSTVLINKLDLRSAHELEVFEAEITSPRANEPLPDGNLDFAHYRVIHRHLFQDVYDWADEVRTVRLSKQGNPFCYPENIEAEAAKLFEELRQADFYRGLPARKFAGHSAHFLAELNAIHAFREGNGRAQLSFFELLADTAGHRVDMEKLDGEQMLSAMIASFEGDEKPLAEAIQRLIA